MSTSLCASCKTKVEDGAVRCVGCGAKLYRPGTFIQVVGWVVAALSLIPFSISEVTTVERDIRPLITGIGVVLAGIVMVMMGRARNKTAQPPVITETGPAGTPVQP